MEIELGLSGCGIEGAGRHPWEALHNNFGYYFEFIISMQIFASASFIEIKDFQDASWTKCSYNADEQDCWFDIVDCGLLRYRAYFTKTEI